MANILDKIVDQTREDIGRRRKKVAQHDFQSFAEYHRTRRDFGEALRDTDHVSIIAEIKKASPSKGVIREDFSPVIHARDYLENGASAISVLTDEPFFQGTLSYLQEVSALSTVPVLRKDFIIDFYQIEEARAWGADAILLIVRITDGQQLYELHDAATECGLQVLVECYDEADFDRLDFGRCTMVGVNNRDLDTFRVDLHRGVSLLNRVPENIVRISESGLNQPSDLMYLHENGIHSALVGEHFMRQKDPGSELRRFLEIFNTDE
ncbi:indole-3-glycerol phosphate synthase TrpC [Balneolales bacterium ANBcel1]|nr:indole-3-glycerol phosphate synthase TrpC [Balneolales bacterium ANBcel1]